MVRGILMGAHWLDGWLQRRLGRPYHALLGAVLVYEIVQRVRDIWRAGQTGSGVLRLVVTVVFFSLLLVNQLSDLHEHAARRGGKELHE